MDIPVITKEEFEKHCPAFASARSETYDLIVPYLDSEAYELAVNYIGSQVKVEGVGVFDTTFDETFADNSVLTDIHRDIHRLVSVRAALHAIAHLDVTLTASGFGVVRTDSTAPASPQRVDALREELRTTESSTFDSLRFHLVYHSTWRETQTAKAEVDMLLWNPTLARRYGISCNGRRVYEDEYRAMLPKLRAGEDLLADIISPALYEKLVEMERAEQDASIYDLLKERCRKYIAYYVQQGEDKYLLKMRDGLISFLREHEDQFPQYKNSTTHDSYERTRFTKNPGNGCLFFA